jgi:chromate transport protein ChrA
MLEIAILTGWSASRRCGSVVNGVNSVVRRVVVLVVILSFAALAKDAVEKENDESDEGNGHDEDGGGLDLG